jgi:hypothetical protein
MRERGQSSVNGLRGISVGPLCTDLQPKNYLTGAGERPLAIRNLILRPAAQAPAGRRSSGGVESRNARDGPPQCCSWKGFTRRHRIQRRADMPPAMKLALRKFPQSAWRQPFAKSDNHGMRGGAGVAPGPLEPITGTGHAPDSRASEHCNQPVAGGLSAIGRKPVSNGSQDIAQPRRRAGLASLPFVP